VDPRKIAQDLKVDAILTGRVTQHSDTLIIQADLINVADGSQLWGEQYNRKLADISSVQPEIARDISDKLQLRLSGEERTHLAKRPTENAEAYQLYLKGLYNLNKRTGESLVRGTEYFSQAIERDPGFALAYVGLADSYTAGSRAVSPESVTKAKAAATKALELDGSLAEAHASLGWSRTREGDWPGGEKELKRAIELNPNYANAHYYYAFGYLTWMGRHDEAIAEMKKARRT
jgi:tetratricopeptide (TPR) repeat protein